MKKGILYLFYGLILASVAIASFMVDPLATRINFILNGLLYGGAAIIIVYGAIRELNQGGSQ